MEVEPVRDRWMITFSIEGDLRFISHHDTVRMFQRALARARLPVKFTEGFNPHPRMSLPVPRPVGIASVCDALVVELDERVGLARVESLSEHLPSGASVVSARRLAPGERVVPELVEYTVALGDASRPTMADLLQTLQESATVPVIRRDHKTGRERTVDLRPFISAVRLEDDHVIFDLRITEKGTAKPSELVTLLGFNPDGMQHCIRRTRIDWQSQAGRQQ